MTVVAHGDLDSVVRDAYLARLGVDAQPPSVEALVLLHQAHAQTVPWETVWIHHGAGWGIDPDTSARRIATEGRGGYCFHLNGAFGLLLVSLGYRVTRHAGGVHGPDGPDGVVVDNHLVLVVHDLPDDTNPGGLWYVDVGLGDALHEPLPLSSGQHRQGPFRFTISTIHDGDADWHLAHDPRGAFPGMAWQATPSAMDAFAERHAWLSTSPDSIFVKILIAQRRDAHGADVLRGLALARVADKTHETRLSSQGELVDALGDVFGINLTGLPSADMEALWSRTEAAQLEWEAAQAPT